jgi:hypothetical protein
MMAQRDAMTVAETAILKELKQIKHLLILHLLRDGATSEQVNVATHMGAGVIRGLFPAKKIGKRNPG